jgi:hypothetical protein
MKADSLGESSISPLNGWDEIDRTALRHQWSLDYFLGFGF